MPDSVDFNYDIRPILSENCFTCHGPDSSSRKAGLRLDIREVATAQLKTGETAIIPKHPGSSALIKRILSTDPDLKMPPPETNKQLTNREIALLDKWIKQGAEWKDYWAFIPPENPDLPTEISKQTPQDIIDYFIEEKLQSKNLEVAPLAYMRGRTLNDSFVILDEAQNTTTSEIKAATTRLAGNALALICGDVDQIDEDRKRYLTKGSSGFANFIHKLHKQTAFCHISCERNFRLPSVSVIADML